MTSSNPYTWGDTAGVSGDLFNTGFELGKIASGTSGSSTSASSFLDQVLKGVQGVGGILGSIGQIGSMARGFPSQTAEFLNQQQQKSTEDIDQRASTTLQQIKDIFSEIGGLTGVSTQDAVQDYYNRFSDYMDKAYAQAREDLNVQPDLTKQYQDLATRIGDIRSSDLNLLNSPQYMAIAKAPQNYMSSVDTAAIKDVMDLGPQYRDRYSYSDAQTQSLMRGRPDAVSEYAAFFANSPDIKQMMEYKV